MKSFFLPLAVLVVAPLAGEARGQETPPINLRGTWDDNGREVIIEQDGAGVIANFAEPPLCDPQDGSEPRPREKNFEGTLSGDSLIGKATVCNWGESWGSEIGIQEIDMRLGVSADGGTLSGKYESWKGPADITLVRLPSTAQITARVTIPSVDYVQAVQVPATETGGRIPPHVYPPLQGTITLSQAAPSGGLVVSLTSGNTAAVHVPATVTVPAGQTSASFTIQTYPVAVQTSAAITAQHGVGAPRSATIEILPPVLDRIVLGLESVQGGTMVQGSVYFTGPAPATTPPIVVYLSSSDPAAWLPVHELGLPSGQRHISVNLLTKPVAEETRVRIYASPTPPPSGAAKGPAAAVVHTDLTATESKSTVIRVLPPVLEGFLNPPLGCDLPCLSASVEVGLTGPAPLGMAIQLESDKPSLSILPMAYVPVGQKKVTVPIALRADAAPGRVNLTAALGGVTKRAEFRIRAGTRPDLVVLRIVVYDEAGIELGASTHGTLASVILPPSGRIRICAEITRAGPREQDPGDYPTPPVYLIFTNWPTDSRSTVLADFGGAASLKGSQAPCASPDFSDFVAMHAPPDAGTEAFVVEVTLDPENRVAERKEDNNATAITLTRSS